MKFLYPSFLEHKLQVGYQTPLQGPRSIEHNSASRASLDRWHLDLPGGQLSRDEATFHVVLVYDSILNMDWPFRNVKPEICPILDVMWTFVPRSRRFAIFL